ncbi:MAG: DUF4147 domain-containing protein [Acidobacteriota bacterium]
MILPSQRFREDFSYILESALLSVKPETLLKRNTSIKGDTLRISDREFSLNEYNNIHVIGIGKGAPSLCKALSNMLGIRIGSGIVISGEQFDTGAENIIALKGDHPIPGNNSFNSGEKLKQYTKKIENNDLVFTLLTGGSSSMAVSPPQGISINDLAVVNDLLVRSGAAIEEINTIRKHLSTIKGGKLAKMIHPAKIISLIISDVNGSDPETIGSGPFYGDNTSFGDAIKVLQKYGIEKRSGRNVIEYLKRGKEGLTGETPSPEDPMFKKNKTFVIGKNIDALNGAALKGKELGYRTQILPKEESGDVREAAQKFAKMIGNRVGNKKGGEELLLFGGEFTVSVKGRGKGGRVQEFLLFLLKFLKDETFPYLIAGAGTDGKDGNSNAAGAWIDNGTAAKIEGDTDSVIDNFLVNNNSNKFFEKIGQLVQTGATGTNVMDIFLIFLK